MIYNDDYVEVYRELPQPISEKQNWESRLDAFDKKMDERFNKGK